MNSGLILGIFSILAGCYGLLSWYSYKEDEIKKDEMVVDKKWAYIPKKARKKQSLQTGIVFLVLGLYLTIRELFFK